MIKLFHLATNLNPDDPIDALEGLVEEILDEPYQDDPGREQKIADINKKFRN